MGRVPVAMLASFARSVSAAAAAGDPISLAILEEAGVRLARAAAAASDHLDAVVSWNGRLFRIGDALIQPFCMELARLIPHVEVQAPSGSSTDGAVLLAREAAAGRLHGAAPYLYVSADATPVPGPAGGGGS